MQPLGAHEVCHKRTRAKVDARLHRSARVLDCARPAKRLIRRHRPADPLHLELLIPALSWPGEHAADAMRAADAPTLARWLSRATRSTAASVQADQWLWQRFTARPAVGEAPGAGHPGSGDLPLAPVTLALDGHAPGTRWWMRADPVHFIVGRTGLRLAPPGHLQLRADESDALAAALRDHFPELAPDFLAPDPARWYLGADRPFELTTTPPADAIGDDVDRNLPRGPGRRRWLGFLNEVQMLWFEHPVNLARERRGEPAASGLWLHGAGLMPAPGRSGLDGASGGGKQLAGLATLAGCRWIDTGEGARDWLAQATGGSWLLSLDALVPPLQAGDAYGWREALAHLEADWFLPLDDALRSGRLASIVLHWPVQDGLAGARIAASDRYRIWRRRRPLADLLVHAGGHPNA